MLWESGTDVDFFLSWCKSGLNCDNVCILADSRRVINLSRFCERVRRITVKGGALKSNGLKVGPCFISVVLGG